MYMHIAVLGAVLEGVHSLILDMCEIISFMVTEALQIE